jgi:hypothetical protein
MKNLKLLPAMLAALLVISAAIFNACSKQESSEPLSTAEQPQMSSADQLILNRIESFKQKVTYIQEHPNFKSGESMIVDSAIWYIGATLNYTYSNAGYPFAKLHRDTAYFEMELLNSYEATIEKIVESYDASLTKLSQSYYRIADEDKKFITASVNATGNNANGNVELQIVTITGTGTITNHEFGEAEAYDFDRNATHDCNGFPADGAPKIFEVHLNSHFIPEPTGNWRWFFYGAETEFTLEYADFVLNEEKTNYLDYKIFAAIDNGVDLIIDDVTECLEYNQDGNEVHEMQFYYDYLVDLIEDEMESYPSYLYYTTKSLIQSPDETINYIRRIWHRPIIKLQRRGKAYFEANEPPITD